MGKYTIVSGDNLSTLASKYGSTVSELAKLNNISNPSLIYAGDKLEIPNYGNTAAVAATPTAAASTSTNPLYEGDEPTYAQSDAVSQAADMLKTQLNNKPADYQSNYSGQIQATLDEILNREDFSYDFNADPMYQQYKDQYISLGNTAMRDTMGNAAALSGGYGNSYATTAGNQAYQGYLGELNNVIPELYSAAYTQYQGEGDDLETQISLLQQQDTADYGKYRDDVSDYVTFLNYYNEAYKDERDFDYNQFLNEWDEWNANRDYGK